MSIIDRARELRKVIESMANTLTDEKALENVELYPKWATGYNYSTDDRINHEGVLYKCVQSHTSQSDWSPDKTPALWVVVSIEEWPEWVQPSGAHDAYSEGDKVKHNEKKWISMSDGNVWEPGVYGWNEVN